ncbi:peptidase M28 [Viridothelium virens]|uniref:Peptide hydrolase n=1 Tax=Viridothelium virens TaxID=1048519 RepID=A0A6A6H146_VIRVR|nr:peptidase M28 [Viridothelium virens]
MSRLFWVSCFSCITSIALGDSNASWSLPQPTFGIDGSPLWNAGAWPPSNVGVPLVPQAADSELTDLLSQFNTSRIQNIIETLTNFGTRHTLSTQTDPTRGIGAARDWIAKEMRALAAPSNGSMVVTTPSYIQPVADRIPFPVNITNIVATIKGYGEPNRAYVVTGHYDSRRLDVMNYTGDAPGSDDNASGVAVVLEMARICATKQPYATMIFAAVAGEEQNLYGSNFLAQSLKNASVDVEANLNNDIVGTGSNEPYDPVNEHTIRLFGAGTNYLTNTSIADVMISIGGENDTPARNLGRFVQEVNEGAVASTDMQVALVYRADRFFRGGDHESFLSAGVSAVRFTEPNEDFRHQHQDPRVQDGTLYGDDMQFVDYDYTARVGRVNLAAMWSIANAPALPTDVTFDVIDLLNETQFYWQIQNSSLLQGYELVWRPSSQQQWTHSYYVGMVDQVTVNLSKDNVVFGLRAVGKNGKKSPAVFPLPDPAEYGPY